MSSKRRTVAIAAGIGALLLAVLGAVYGDEGERRGESLTPIERWERLGDEERAHLRERFERYQRMSLAERTELAERADTVARTERRILARLSPEERDRMGRLDDAQRRQILDELVEDELKAQGRRLRAKLPEEVRERLEAASWEERLRFFNDFKQKSRQRMSGMALDKLGRRLGYEPEAIQAMRRLPEQERLMKVLELQKLLQARSVEENGLPAGLTAERWGEMLELAPEDFYAEVMRIREAIGWRPIDGHGTEPLDPELARRRIAAREVLVELRPRPTERLELAELPAPERRREIAIRRRARIQHVLEEHEVFAPDALAQLADVGDGEFFRRVRELVNESGVLGEGGSKAR